MAWLCLIFCLGAVNVATATNYACEPEVQLLQQYIQIDTTTHNDLTPAVNFWRKHAAKAGLPLTVHTFTEGYPIVVMKWAGTDPSLNSIILNSHMDVVPADNDGSWTHPPFSGYLSNDGVVWGRGVQDMKSVGIQHFEAIKRLKAKNVRLLRDIYITLMPDEEVGGRNGIISFLQSQAFKDMNVGFMLDESTGYDLPLIPLFFQDKAVWQIKVDCYGNGAHGSLLEDTESTATGKCRNVMNTLLKFREEQYLESLLADITDASGYTSVNLNRMSAGTATNIVPNHVSLTFDMRLSTTMNEEYFDRQIHEWISAAGDNITLTYISKNSQSPATRVDDGNPYWTTIAEVANELGIMVVPTIPPASTDSRHARLAGIPAFGFSPMPNTELLAHVSNERLSASTFLRGIEIFEHMIERLANIPGDQTLANPSDYNIVTADQST